MFSPASAFPEPLPRPRVGLRRGGPVLLREVLPDALEQALSAAAPRGGPPASERPTGPRWPPLPHAA